MLFFCLFDLLYQSAITDKTLLDINSRELEMQKSGCTAS